LPSGWRWVRPDYFLLPKLTVIESLDAFVNVANIQTYQGRPTDSSPIPPFKEEISTYLEADYVQDNCWFERTAEEFIFKVKLPMSEGSHLEGSRSYKFADLNRVDAYDLPVTEIWPARRLEGWKYFCTFWGRDDETSRFYVRPCGVPIVKAKKSIDLSTKEEVTITSQPPQYLTCSEMKSTAVGVQFEPLGLVLPSYKALDPSPNPRAFTIGFDFGTTNTNIFLSGIGEKPVPLVIPPETVRIFKNEERKREGLMYRLFLPPEKESAPFLSLLRRRISPTGGFVAIRDAHVLFYNREVESAQFEDQTVESYLKWNNRLNDDRTAFLSQLVLHAAYCARLNGAQSLQFIYSYPTAFDERTSEVLESFWSSDVPKMTADVGIRCQFAAKQTESIATAYYFNNIKAAQRALLGVGALVMDIGGGTTDISIWSKNKLEIQTSVRLSGREILLGPLQENKEYVLPMLARCMDDGEAILSPLTELIGERFFRRADAILRSNGDHLLSRLNSLLMVDDFERFRSEIAIRVAALMYYSGLLLRRLNWLETGAPLPDIYVGGNGSRVFNWLAPPQYQESHPIHKLLMGAYAAGAGLDQTPSSRLILSSEPKSEVACGLVYSLEMKLAKPDDAVQTIAGEAFDSNGVAKKQTDSLSSQILKQGIHVTRADEIQNLLRIYNDFADRFGAILLPVSNVQLVVDRAIDEINERALERTHLDIKDISLEPLFITGAVHAFSLIKWRAATKHAVSG